MELTPEQTKYILTMYRRAQYLEERPVRLSPPLLTEKTGVAGSTFKTDEIELEKIQIEKNNLSKIGRTWRKIDPSIKSIVAGEALVLIGESLGIDIFERIDPAEFDQVILETFRLGDFIDSTLKILTNEVGNYSGQDRLERAAVSAILNVWEEVNGKVPLKPAPAVMAESPNKKSKTRKFCEYCAKTLLRLDPEKYKVKHDHPSYHAAREKEMIESVAYHLRSIREISRKKR